MASQKQLLDVFKNNRFDALTFNADGSRAAHYGNLDLLQCFTYVSQKLAKGERVLVFAREEAGFTVYNALYGTYSGGVSKSQTDPDFYEKALHLAWAGKLEELTTSIV